MKRIFLKAAAAAFFACSAISAQAINPYTDVDTGEWAYQAVSDLSDQGVVEGYPDGTFKGQKHITRFEMAQIIARLMARSDQLTAEQQQQVRMLSGEYSDELKSLGVRVAELEKKVGKTDLIWEVRVHGVNRYDNIFSDTKKDHYELGARVRLNSITKVNERTTFFGQAETYISMNHHDMYDVNADHDEDSHFHVNRLFATYQFGGQTQEDREKPFGPSRNLIAIGAFPVQIGLTGYTYSGPVKGAFIQFGDYERGHNLTIAYGNASDINYRYTGPMMHGVGFTAQQVGGIVAKATGSTATGQAIATALSSDNAAVRAATLKQLQSMAANYPAISSMVNNLEVTGTDRLNNGNPAALTYFPMGIDRVHMGWGDDEDTPVHFISYKYKAPGKAEFHAYFVKACGPVNNIVQGYGFAGQVYLTKDLSIRGEYVKNLRVLPLNNEKPYSFNWGIQYGKADILKPRSWSLGLDYVYSQAGTYFGGGSDIIADQYMGHVYSDWHGTGPLPAYFADKMDGMLKGETGKKYGGAKFYLAKASYVPMKGLILTAEYGFHASDMGGKKMDNMLLLMATAYIK